MKGENKMKNFKIGQIVYQNMLFDVVELKIMSEKSGDGYLVENAEGKRFWQHEDELFMLKSSAYAEILANIKHRMDIAKKDYDWGRSNYKIVKNRLLQSQKEEKGIK